MAEAAKRLAGAATAKHACAPVLSGCAERRGACYDFTVQYATLGLDLGESLACTIGRLC